MTFACKFVSIRTLLPTQIKICYKQTRKKQSSLPSSMSHVSLAWEILALRFVEKFVSCLTGLNECTLQQTHSTFSWANWRKLNLNSQDEWKWEWNANSHTTYSGFSVCLIVIYLIELPHSIIFSSSIDRAMQV